MVRVSANSRHLVPWALAIVAGGIFLGLLAAYPSLLRLTREFGVPVKPATVAAESQSKPIDGGNAMAFARALQDNNCDEVIRLTAWMADRLRRVALESSDPEDVAEARRKLCQKILSRPYEDNILRGEGIEDQFVFAPGTQLEVVSKDPGRKDLGRPVAERVWIRVTYPRRETAPLAPVKPGSPDMKPVRQWIVGVNLSQGDQTVLKASVLGNLEIKRDSAAFDWPQA